MQELRIIEINIYSLALKAVIRRIYIDIIKIYREDIIDVLNKVFNLNIIYIA
jgi:hypothetical protein